MYNNNNNTATRTATSTKTTTVIIIMYYSWQSYRLKQEQKHDKAYIKIMSKLEVNNI